MRRIWIVFAIGLLAVIPVLAQDRTETTGYMYYEEHHPDRLAGVLLYENLCLERIMQLNPELDITNIPYGTLIEIPLNEPCYDIEESGYQRYDSPRLKYYEDGKWLVEPYYSSHVSYLASYTTIHHLAAHFSVCVEDLLNDNILLQDFESYKTFSYGFSLDVFIPQGDTTCPPESGLPRNTKAISVSQADFYPSYFSQVLNICPEEVFRTQPYNTYLANPADEYNFEISLDFPPCYNEQGQRLTYYDNNGIQLDEPIYSDLSVYEVKAGETIETIAQSLDVCMVDLVRINGFPNTPIVKGQELFVPPQRDCPDDVKAVAISLNTNPTLSLNICPSILAELNPFYRQEHTNRVLRANGGRGGNAPSQWMIIPTTYAPCYTQYEAQAGQFLMDIERELNICREDFIVPGYLPPNANFKLEQDITIQVPTDILPCYNEQGQRLYNPPTQTSNNLPARSPYYADMIYYKVEESDTLYSLSRKFNVCVHDIQLANYQFQPDYYIYIPNTPPCYDAETGNTLIYKDENGQALLEPKVSEHVMYYGEYFNMDRIFNVCENRIEDANRAKLNRETAYLGWIIPTDRPPCYDDNGHQINYVCYTQPIDMNADYRDLDEVISFNVDGTHCYDLADPNTVVWYENQPYQVINYHGNLLKSRAFTAWCYGVSQEEIDTINVNEYALEMLSFHERLIPQPTRDCYLDHPEILEKAPTVHIVQSGETVSDIAKQYDMPYQLIALANDLDSDYTIWDGQKLIIPDGFTWRGLTAFGGSVSAIGLLLILLYRRNHRTYRKKKGIPKNDDKRITS